MKSSGSINFRKCLPSSEPLIHTLINSYMMSSSLFSCNELDLFSYLHQNPGASLENIADYCNLVPAQISKLLSFCQSVGLIYHNQLQYYCSIEASKLLSRHSPDNLCAAITNHQQHVYPLLHSLTDSLRDNLPNCDWIVHNSENYLYSRLNKSSEELNMIMEAMNIFSRGAGTRIAQLLDQRVSSSRPLRFLDLGGGGGQVAIELALYLPTARFVLIDLERAVYFAQRKVKQKGLQSRIECIVGDMFSMPGFDRPFDIVLLSSVLGDWNLDDQHTLLANAHKQLRFGGLLVVSETLLDNDLAGPILPTLMSLYAQVLTRGGENFSARRLEQLLQNNHFSKVTVHNNREQGCRDTLIAEKVEIDTKS